MHRRLWNKATTAAVTISCQSFGIDIRPVQRIVHDGFHRNIHVRPEDLSLQRQQPLSRQINCEEIVAPVMGLRRNIHDQIFGESFTAADHNQCLGRFVVIRGFAEIARQYGAFKRNLDIFQGRIE